MAMRKFKVPVEGTVCAEYDGIEAKDHEEAERIARRRFRDEHRGIVFDDIHSDAELLDEEAQGAD